MNFPFFKYNKGLPVIIPGKNLTSAEAESLTESARIIIRECPSRIAVNLENVESIDSSGISFLVHVAKETRNAGIELIIYSMNDSLQRLFYAAGLDSFFTICTASEFRKNYK